MKVAAFFALLAVAPASSSSPYDSAFAKQKKEFNKLQARKEVVVPIPMHKYATDCGMKANLRIKPNALSMLQDSNVPGAGVEKFKPFEQVLKDGFMEIDCVKDYMYYRGDKFGDNKHDYKLGPVSDVSIVHYDAFVAKEDQAEMTQKKCFEFCRTVPNMGFFGIVNGRGCYCTPYYNAMESDSTRCDSVCEGDNTLRCGGKSKSSIFAMHMCDSTADDLSTRSDNAAYMEELVRGEASHTSELSKSMQTFGSQLQKTFGAVGNSGATGLAQDAKVFAGTLVHKSEDADKLADKLGDLVSSARSLQDFGKPATVTKAERLMEGIDETVAEAEAMAHELAPLVALATGEASTAGGKVEVVSSGKYAWTEAATNVFNDMKEIVAFDPPAVDFETCSQPSVGSEVTQHCKSSMERGDFWEYFVNAGFIAESMEDVTSVKQYYPVMYFVDKEFEEVPTTCSGARVAKPIVGQSANGCAEACDANIHSCVGFQYFEKGDQKLCFLLSRFSEGFYYTGCGKSFLQTISAPFKAKCYAKLSKFEGTTLKPDPSGKCEQCFKQLTKADRCY